MNRILLVLVGLMLLAGLMFIVSPKVKIATPFMVSHIEPSLTAKIIVMSYHGNIIKDTQENEYFRRVLFTGKNSQLVVMSIPPGGEVGKETHTYTEQTLFFLRGTGEGEFDGKTFPVVPGDVVVVVPGTEHNFRNTGAEPLKLYTVYAPPNHIDGRVHATKAEADADTADEAIGESAPPK